MSHWWKSVPVRVKSWLGNAALLAGSVLCMELILQLVCALSQRADVVLSPAGSKAVPEIAATISDDRLGWRPNPAVSDHDSNGWRNKRALQQAAVVALGDSQTYGAGVPRGMAWPEQLAHEAGTTVYS